MTTTFEGNNPSIALIVGGNGGSVVAGGLVDAMPEVRLSTIVCVTDHGSKSGEVRDTYGGGSVGDLTEHYKVLSGNGAGPLFGHRFSPEVTSDDLPGYNEKILGMISTDYRGRATDILSQVTELSRRLPSLKGHKYGNLILTALRLDYDGDIAPAAREANLWLDTRATVIPVTSDSSDLVMFDGEKVIWGEGEIDDHIVAKPFETHVWLEPSAHITAEAYDAIAGSDLTIVGPGSIFTSLMPCLVPIGVASALQVQREHGGRLVAISNLIQEERATRGLDVTDFTRAMESKTKRPFDFVIYNDATDLVPQGTVPVAYGIERLETLEGTAISANLVATSLGEPNPHDPISHLRSYVHHDAEAIARVIRSQVFASFKQLSY